jgi:hypothetical protein
MPSQKFPLPKFHWPKTYGDQTRTEQVAGAMIGVNNFLYSTG